MDNELQTYTDRIMDQQQYRSGIFPNVLSPILNAIASFRFSANMRGVIHARSDDWMDKNLEIYVEQTLESQIYRGGISFTPSIVRRFVSLFRRS